MRSFNSRRTIAAFGLAAVTTGCLALALPVAQGAKTKLRSAALSSGTVALDIPDSDLNPEPNAVEHLVRVPLELSIPAKGRITDVDVGVRISATAATGSMPTPSSTSPLRPASSA